MPSPGPYTARRRSGQTFLAPPSELWNGMADAGLDYQYRQKLGKAGVNSPAFLPNNLVKLKNASGGNLVAGRVLEIGAAQVTTVNRSKLWFTGNTPSPDGADVIAVTLQPVRSNGYVWCVTSGLCYCRLNVNHVQQRYCDVDSSSTLLQTKWHGRGQVIWRATDATTPATGEQDAVITLGPMFCGPIVCNAGSGITTGSHANCAVRWAGAAASPASNIDVYLTDLAGVNVTSGHNIFAWWIADEQKYQVGNEACS